MRIPRAVVWAACLGLVLSGATALAASAPTAHASAQRFMSGNPLQQPPTAGAWVEITGLERCGCGLNQIVVDYFWSNIPVGSIGHITVVVDGVVYEDSVSSPVAPGNTSGSGTLPLYNDNSGGTATGTWPLPSGKPVEITFTAEYPVGTIVAGWKSVLDSCSGTCAFSTSEQFGVNYPIPAATTIGLAGLAALLLIAGVFFLLRGRAS